MQTKESVHVQGSEGREAMGHQSHVDSGTDTGGFELCLLQQTESTTAVTMGSTTRPNSQEKPRQASLSTRTESLCLLLWAPAQMNTPLVGLNQEVTCLPSRK